MHCQDPAGLDVYLKRDCVRIHTALYVLHQKAGTILWSRSHTLQSPPTFRRPCMCRAALLMIPSRCWEQVLDDIQDAFERGPQRAPLTEQSLNRGRPRSGAAGGNNQQGLGSPASYASPGHSVTSFATSVSSFDTGAAAGGSVTGAVPVPSQGLGLPPQGAISPLTTRGKHARAGSLGGVGSRSVVQRTESASHHGRTLRPGSETFTAGLKRQGSWG